MNPAMGLLSNPLTIVLVAVPLPYPAMIHEPAHGRVAAPDGRSDGKERPGRLGLIPLGHLDPIGTLTLFRFGFGGAKPVMNKGRKIFWRKM
jgi:hypothetical protein